MDVRISAEMLDALRNTSEIPDNLLAAVNSASAVDADFVLRLNEDESMAMTEMCEWYITKDSATGELTEKAKIFDGIVRAIYEADLA